MTTTTDEKWIDSFIVELRLRRVTGPAIGDAVASVRELLADSGQSAEEAFGSPRVYAASLALPASSLREQALRSVWLPILGLVAFLAFAQASTAWFSRELVLISAPQAVLLSVPMLLALLAFTWPLYVRTVVRQRWLPALLPIAAGAAGALSALVAPSSASDAWLAMPALPLLVGTAGVMLVLSAIGTVLSRRNRGVDEIVEPLPAVGGAKQGGNRHPALLIANWLFPILAGVVFAMTWVFSVL